MLWRAGLTDNLFSDFSNIDFLEIENRPALFETRIGKNFINQLIKFLNVRIGANCIIGANALIPENKEIPDNSLVVGSPGRVVRQVSEAQAAELKLSAAHYVENARRFAAGLVSESG